MVLVLATNALYGLFRLRDQPEDNVSFDVLAMHCFDARLLRDAVLLLTCQSRNAPSTSAANVRRISASIRTRLQ